MSDHAKPSQLPESAQLPRLIGWIFGGLCLALGFVLLYYSFGSSVPGDLNGNFHDVGFSALDNIALKPAADFSFGLLAAGALTMVFLNATAWKSTGGY